MPGDPFRFIHASDFHLEEPLHGLTSVPEHLRDLLIDAPFVAARRVFDTALAEEVDFVVLAGDVLQPRGAGPRGIEFIRRHLARLHDRQIGVYWAAGSIDGPNQWPPSVPLPESVHHFPEGRVTDVTHHRGGKPVATILGISGGVKRKKGGTDFDVASSQLCCIAVAHGAPTRKTLQCKGISYWALGGKHTATKLPSARVPAHFCGSPQGRDPTEEGPHGCVVVHVDEHGEPDARKVATDIVRWHTESIELTLDMSQSDLENHLCERARQLSEAANGRQLLVSWRITGEDELADSPARGLAAQLRHSGLAEELASVLRRDFGMTVPGVWTVDLQATPPERLPAEWYEEDTILGELLRLVQHYQDHEDEPLEDLDVYLSQRQMTAELAAAIKISGRRERREILRRVAALGADLLRGDGLP